MAIWPFTLSAGAFLLLMVVLIPLAVVASIALAHWLRPEGRPERPDNIEQIAFLAGGKIRLAESAAARLLVARALRIEGGKDLVAASGVTGETGVERAILAAARPAGWRAIALAIEGEAARIDAQLVRKGLLMDHKAGLPFALLTCAPLLIVLILGFVRTLIGLEHNRPVGFLVMLLIVAAVISIIRFTMVRRLTLAGEAALAQESARKERLRRAPVQEEYGEAVALYGTGVLAGSYLSDFYSLRRQSNGSSGDSGDGGDGGDGGCGGGCGGCGG